MAIKNGQIEVSSLTKLSTGGYLEASTAQSYELMRIEVFLNCDGFVLKPTSVFDAYRDYDVQVKTFLSRYKVQWTGKGAYGDVRWWKGKRYVRFAGAAAAVPGKSNHGLASTVDFAGLGGFTGTIYKYLVKRGPFFGWDNVEGTKVREYWHWTRVASKDKSSKYRGWYHTTRATRTYTQKGEKSSARPEDHNVYIRGVIKWKGVHWGVHKNGTLFRWSHLKKGKSPSVRYYVVTANALNARSSMDTSSKKNVIATRPKGYKFAAVKKITRGDTVWLETRHGNYYAFSSGKTTYVKEA